MIYLLSFVILISSTICICMSLTVKRSTIQRSENSKIQDRNKRAAIIVSVIVYLNLYLRFATIRSFSTNRMIDACLVFISTNS